MAATTAPTKQTLHNQPALIALGEALHFLPHHTQAFRKRHLLFLILSVVLMASMILEVAVIVARQSLDPRLLFSQAATSPAVKTTSYVRSSNGFSLAFNNQQFSATVHGGGIDGVASEAELAKGNALTSVTLNPLPSQVPASEAVSEFEIVAETDAAAFATFKSHAKPKTDIATVTSDYFAPTPTNSANITEESRTTEPIGGSLMTKVVYVVSPKFAGNPTRTVVWSAQITGRPLAISVRGIVAGSTVPSSIQPIISTIKLASDAKVEGLSILKKQPVAPIVDQKYVADLVSPSVVKVYHMICGSLVYNNKSISGDTCSAATGSGFLVSADGYVATNGHVVVYGAKDMLVNALLSNHELLEQFLSGSKLNDSQIQEILQRPELTASVVSGIYDLPNNALRLLNQRELTVVAIGDTPLDIKDEAAVKRLVGKFDSTTNLRQATVVGYDYSSKDQLTVISDPKQGFSASDVALLKINISNAPFAKLSKSAVTQNQKISLFGFPGDADNQLTDNTVLGVTVTNGSISSIRDAAGSSSKLYQSDADASHGNSGGPAVDEYGDVFGLLTYRYESGASGDAAKSYIRDIADFKLLAQNKGVTLNTNSAAQTAWQLGLGLYSKHHYSEAALQFERVKELYPAHRLASTYIDLSNQAVKDGKDIKDPPVLLLVFGIGTGLGGLGLAVVLIARHHGRHQVYRAYHRHGLAHSISV
jgi:S1-C subfamily serine protease